MLPSVCDYRDMLMACTHDEVNAVVVDIGSYQTKVGYAGEDTPKFVYPSLVGEQGGALGGERSCNNVGETTNGTARRLAGIHALSAPQTGMEVVSPYQGGGLLSDWEAVERLLSWGFADQMHLRMEEHPVMMAEPSGTSKAARERTAQLLFESCNTPAIFLSKNAVLSAFSMGRQTALIVDAGHKSTSGACRGVAC
ncbi:actin [Helicosporidium sp. ATCC 50920]|nr:actin [Helicosporidium sp. ATCC 50920]|eukprot:KDD76648.1 actin [Helicosporidium sp. ATCC 50920]